MVLYLDDTQATFRHLVHRYCVYMIPDIYYSHIGVPNYLLLKSVVIVRERNPAGAGPRLAFHNRCLSRSPFPD